MSKIRNVFRSLGVAVGSGINIFCIAHCLVEYGGEVTFLTGPSMLPNFNQNTNNIVFVEHITNRWKSFNVGDVVISKSPLEPNKMVCKRVAAIEGQRVKRPDGMFGKSASKYLEIPHGHLWLLGDNPENSTDSRFYGPVPLGLIRGRVCFKIWPISEFGRFKQ